MDRYANYNLRGDRDETLRRAFRDGFKRAGLSHAQLLEAMEWYRDYGQRLGADPTKLSESFHDFATNKGWPAERLVAATSVYDVIAEQGPTAVLEPTTAETDAATIARADELLSGCRP